MILQTKIKRKSRTKKLRLRIYFLIILSSFFLVHWQKQSKDIFINF